MTMWFFCVVRRPHFRRNRHVSMCFTRVLGNVYDGIVIQCICYCLVEEIVIVDFMKKKLSVLLRLFGGIWGAVETKLRMGMLMETRRDGGGNGWKPGKHENNASIDVPRLSLLLSSRKRRFLCLFPPTALGLSVMRGERRIQVCSCGLSQPSA